MGANSEHAVLTIAPVGRELVRVFGDGRIEYGADYDPDETARTFWEVMAACMPRCPACGVEPPPEPDGDPNSLTCRIERALLARHPVTLLPERARNYAEIAAFVAQGGQ